MVQDDLSNGIRVQTRKRRYVLMAAGKRIIFEYDQVVFIRNCNVQASNKKSPVDKTTGLFCVNPVNKCKTKNFRCEEKGVLVMKLLMSVFMIRFIMALFDNKAKRNKTGVQNNTNETDARHPAAFQVR